jgi:predicted GIY-YIG superfamily endonuclease
MRMAWVYILQTKAGKYYVGSTTDIDERLKHHIGGYTPSTKSLGVEQLLLKQEYKTLVEARSVEQKIKNLKRKDYIVKMLQDGYIKIMPE